MQPYSPLGSPGTYEAGTPNPLEDEVIKQIAVKHNATPAHVRNEGCVCVWGGGGFGINITALFVFMTCCKKKKCFMLKLTDYYFKIIILLLL